MKVISLRKKTSCSLSSELKSALFFSKKKTGMSISKLATTCLKKLLKKKNLEFSRAITVKYNPDKASEKIYLYLTSEEQISLRTIRACHAISISYLLSVAIKRFLAGIVRLLLSKRHNNARINHWLYVLGKNLRGIHRRELFIAKQAIGFTTIMIKRKKL